MFLVFFALIFGLIIGNVGTSVLYRVSNNMPINGMAILQGTPPHCSICKHPLRYYEYLPGINWFFIKKGRCNYCHASIDRAYHIIELSASIISLVCYLSSGFGLRYLCTLILGVSSVVLGILFYRKITIPIKCISFLLWTGFICNFYYHYNLFSMTFEFIIILFVHFVWASAYLYSAENKKWQVAHCGIIGIIWLPIYLYCPLFIFLYCFFKQHEYLWRYLYIIFLIPVWIFAMLW